MSVFEDKTHEKMGEPNTSDPAQIDRLIADLDSDDGLVRQQARIALAHLGQPAVAPLIKAFQDRVGCAQWEAAKALSQIGDPASVNALVTALEDEPFSIRWLAAEGLVTVGRPSLEPLLLALIDRPDSVRLREGIHHVLHDLVSQRKLESSLKRQISQVLAALRGVEPALETPVAAHKALQALYLLNNSR